MERPDPPSDTPGASKQAVLTPHDIQGVLGKFFFLEPGPSPAGHREIFFVFQTWKLHGPSPATFRGKTSVHVIFCNFFWSLEKDLVKEKNAKNGVTISFFLVW